MTYCKKCGACCRILPIAVTKVTPEERQIIEMRKNAYVDTIDGVTYIVLMSPCKYYNTEIKRCSIYDRRPHYCRNFTIGGIECKEARKLEGVPDDVLARITT